MSMSTLTRRQLEPLDRYDAGADLAPDAALPGGDLSGTVDLDVDDLRALMEAVGETSRRLQETHAVLQQEVTRLQGELAEANAQLRRSRALAELGQMAAGIAHEIRNPLASIQLYAQMLAEDIADRPDQAGLCRKIDRAVTSLDAIVRDVLVFSRDVRVAATPTVTTSLFDRALEGCAALIERGRVEVERSALADLPLEADETLLGQALANLIRNAVEAMIEWKREPAAPRRLRLGASRALARGSDGRRHECIILSIEDTGPGIPDDVIPRMFNPFFTTRTTGTGLGLAIVHRIVDAHGGHINVSHLEPHGTRLELCLREAPPPAGDGAGERGPAPDIEILTPSRTLEHGR